MYEVESVSVDALFELEEQGYIDTVFKTRRQLSFLEKNQKGQGVLLRFFENGKTLCYFVGMVIKKFGIRILGSPFEGWLTSDMGFIKVEDFDLSTALFSLKKFAFKSLKCKLVQIIDSSITCDKLDKKIKYKLIKELYIDNSRPLEEILEGFKKNGRRDVRASERKETVVKKVPFDKEFCDLYYSQLIQVFAKQKLKPFYDVQKIYDLAEAYSDKPEQALALVAESKEGKPLATVFSLGAGEWAYFIGAASFTDSVKDLPNERLFWEFVKHWREKGIKNLNLVGYREYKLKYNPRIVDLPIVYFEKIKGLLFMKNLAKKVISLLRKIKGKI